MHVSCLQNDYLQGYYVNKSIKSLRYTSVTVANAGSTCLQVVFTHELQR